MNNKSVAKHFPNLSSVECFLNDFNPEVDVVVGCMGGRKLTVGEKKHKITMNQLVKRIETLAVNSEYTDALPDQLTRILSNALVLNLKANAQYKVITKNRPIARLIRSITSKLGLFLYDRKKIFSRYQNRADAQSKLETQALGPFSSPKSKKVFLDSIKMYFDKQKSEKDSEIAELRKKKESEFIQLFNKYSIPFELGADLEWLKKAWNASLDEQVQKNTDVCLKMSALDDEGFHEEIKGLKIAERVSDYGELQSSFLEIDDQISLMNVANIAINIKKKLLEVNPGSILSKIDRICQIMDLEMDELTYDAFLLKINEWVLNNHPDKQKNLNADFESLLECRREIKELIAHIATEEEIREGTRNIKLDSSYST